MSQTNLPLEQLRFDFTHLKLTEDQQAELLQILVEGSYRYFLSSGLKKWNIPGRTTIYKNYGWNRNAWNPKTQTMTKPSKPISDMKKILKHSTIWEWLDLWCQENSISNLDSIFRGMNIDIDGFYVRVTRDQRWYVPKMELEDSEIKLQEVA